MGFDFPHLAAISGDAAVSNSSRFGHQGHQRQGFFVAIPFGAYPYYAEDASVAEQPEQQSEQPRENPEQSQNFSAEQPISSSPAEPGLSYTGAENLSSPASAESPVRDIGDFILVRRDGRILFASLFTVVGTQLRYITPDGFRHTMAISDLDSDATQQMNEARGSTVQIHN